MSARRVMIDKQNKRIKRTYSGSGHLRGGSTRESVSFVHDASLATLQVDLTPSHARLDSSWSKSLATPSAYLFTPLKDTCARRRAICMSDKLYGLPDTPLHEPTKHAVTSCACDSCHSLRSSRQNTRWNFGDLRTCKHHERHCVCRAVQKSNTKETRKAAGLHSLRLNTFKSMSSTRPQTWCRPQCCMHVWLMCWGRFCG